MTKSRRHLTAPQRAEIIRRHVGGKEPVSNLADEFLVRPTQIHTWVKQVLDQTEQAFETTTTRATKPADDIRIWRLFTFIDWVVSYQTARNQVLERCTRIRAGETNDRRAKC